MTGLTLRVVHRHEGGPPRLAVAVGRRVSPRAVDRNRVARRLRAALQHELSSLTPGVDLLFVPTTPARAYTWEHVTRAVHALLERARVLKQHEA